MASFLVLAQGEMHKADIKRCRIMEWVMSEGERYYSIEDVLHTDGQVYPFGPDMKELLV